MNKKSRSTFWELTGGVMDCAVRLKAIGNVLYRDKRKLVENSAELGGKQHLAVSTDCVK